MNLDYEKERLMIAASWRARIKKAGYNHLSQFCHEHEFNLETLSRHLNAKRCPTRSTIKLMEIALKSKGV